MVSGVLFWFFLLSCPHPVNEPAPQRIFLSPHTTGHLCPWLHSSKNAPIRSYSCFQGNQQGTIYKGRKQTAATQSCNIGTSGADLSCPFPLQPCQLPHSSCKGWVTHFIFYNHIRQSSLRFGFCFFFLKASYWSFKVRVKFSSFYWSKSIWGRKQNYINHLNLHSNLVFPPSRSRKTYQV